MTVLQRIAEMLFGTRPAEPDERSTKANHLRRLEVDVRRTTSRVDRIRHEAYQAERRLRQ